MLFMAAVCAPIARAQTNDAIVPVVDEAPTKANSYNWMDRHNALVARAKQGHVDLLFVGDSITHIWGGDVEHPTGGRANDVWTKYYGDRNAFNIGCGWDRTQHVLWRLEHGEVDGLHPKVAVVLIGTNNVGSNTPDQIVEGVAAIVHTIHDKSRRTKILLLGIFPRDAKPDTYNRKQVAEINGKVAAGIKDRYVTYLDIGAKFLELDGTISKDTMPDFLHPSHKGYEIWAAEMEPTLAKLLGDKPKSQ
jgi:lysophospholipase L1-like esterase